MPRYDHEAIRKAYPDAQVIDNDRGVFIGDGVTKINIVQSEIDAARTAMDKEISDTKYQRDREKDYPLIQDQLDMQYWDKKNGTTTWVDAIAKVKSDNPKP